MALNQKPISLRINLDVLQQVDELCAQEHLKRNAVINMALKFYLGHHKLLDDNTQAEV